MTRGVNHVDEEGEFQAEEAANAGALGENVLCTSEDKQRRPEKTERRLTADEDRGVMDTGTMVNLAGHCVDFAFAPKKWEDFVGFKEQSCLLTERKTRSSGSLQAE